MSDDKVISKIRKMLAVAHDEGASEGERDNAMRMAHAYMVKHNLAMTAVEEKVEKRIMNSGVFYGNRWSRSIMAVIGELFFCHFSYVAGGNGVKDKNMFVGLESNTITAMEISLFVIKSITKESNRLRKKLGMNSKFSLSFCYGAAIKIGQRCDEIKNSSIKNEPGTGIVLASFYDQESFNNDKFNEDAGRTIEPAKPIHVRVNEYGKTMGANFASGLPLNTQIAN